MSKRRILALGAACLGLAPLPALAQNPVTLSSVSAYGTLEAGGVVVTITGDSERNATATLEWRGTGDPTFRPAHPLSRIDATRFAGSLFWLQPASSQDVRVTLVDPDGVSGSASATTTLLTRSATFAEPTLRTLYVSPSGNDSNPGTSPGLPLLTIQRAATLALAGDLVLIQPGIYRETVSVPRSGSSTQPIVFRGDGPGAVLDGADAAIASGVTWTAQAGNVFTRVLGFSTGHVTADDFRLYRYGSVAELQALGAGPLGGFFFDGTTLHVKLADLSSPEGHSMQVARLEDGFVIDGRAHVRVEDLEIRHYGQGDYGKGVYLRQSSDCAVLNSRIHHIGNAGVWVKGGARNRIEGNEIWDNGIFDWQWDLAKGSSAETNAITFTDDIGRGNVVRGNITRGTFNGIAPCGGLAPPGGVVTSETDVYDNVLSQHLDDALEPEGHCSNVRIWGNRIQDVHMAFAVAPAAPGPTYILRNVVWRHGNTRASQQDGWLASALKINSGYPAPVGPLFLYHNTVLTDAPGTDVMALLNPGFSTFVRTRNNVLAGTQYVLYKVNPVTLDMNGDDLYTTDSSRFVRINSTNHLTLAAFRSATLQEQQGISAPPQLVNPAGGNFRPATGSPLIDAGLVLAGINDGYQGAAPDIGAFEVTGGPELTIDDASVTEGDAGTVTMTFTVTLSAGSAQPVTVQYTTAPSPAKAPAPASRKPPPSQ